MRPVERLIVWTEQSKVATASSLAGGPGPPLSGCRPGAGGGVWGSAPDALLRVAKDKSAPFGIFPVHQWHRMGYTVNTAVGVVRRVVWLGRRKRMVRYWLGIG